MNVILAIVLPYFQFETFKKYDYYLNRLKLSLEKASAIAIF
jgi:hypothetical protein